jgi:hypothetical protein
MTVDGLTMISASFQRAQVRESNTQSPRSAFGQPRPFDGALEHAELMAEGN